MSITSYTTAAFAAVAGIAIVQHADAATFEEKLSDLNLSATYADSVAGSMSQLARDPHQLDADFYAVSAVADLIYAHNLQQSVSPSVRLRLPKAQLRSAMQKFKNNKDSAHLYACRVTSYEKDTSARIPVLAAYAVKLSMTGESAHNNSAFVAICEPMFCQAVATMYDMLGNVDESFADQVAVSLLKMETSARIIYEHLEKLNPQAAQRAARLVQDDLNKIRACAKELLRYNCYGSANLRTFCKRFAQ